MKPREVILTIRQNLISAFKQYEYIFIPVLRFLLSLSTLRLLRDVTNYEGLLSNILVLVGISFIGTFVSADWIITLTIFLVTIFMAGSNLLFAIILFIGMWCIYVLYAKLFPREGLLIITTLVAFSMKLELVIPIVGALFGTYMSIVAIIIGIILWFTLPTIKSILPVISLEKDVLLDTFNQLMAINYREIMMNTEMMVTIVIFFIVFSAIYIIRKQSIDYGPYIAIAVGAVMNILGFGLAIIFFENIEINLLVISLETIGFSLVAIVMQFLYIALDYQRAEMVNFEDDDNYYYVKIVPKIQLTHKHKLVKRIYVEGSSKDDQSMTQGQDINIDL